MPTDTIEQDLERLEYFVNAPPIDERSQVLAWQALARIRAALAEGKAPLSLSALHEALTTFVRNPSEINGRLAALAARLATAPSTPSQSSAGSGERKTCPTCGFVEQDTSSAGGCECEVEPAPVDSEPTELVLLGECVPGYGMPAEPTPVMNGEEFIQSLEYLTNGQCVLCADSWTATMFDAGKLEGGKGVGYEAMTAVVEAARHATVWYVDRFGEPLAFSSMSDLLAAISALDAASGARCACECHVTQGIMHFVSCCVAPFDSSGRGVKL